VQLVSQEVCASLATVTVIDREEGAPWPIFDRFEFRFNDIQYDAHSIFIIIPNHSLVSVR